MERHYKGSELKYALTIKSHGFSMNDDPWTATVINGRSKVTCSKESNAVCGDCGQWYIIVDTNKLDPGLCYLIVDIDIPDSDFEDGYRHEVLEQEQALFFLALPKAVTKPCGCKRF